MLLISSSIMGQKQSSKSSKSKRYEHMTKMQRVLQLEFEKMYKAIAKYKFANPSVSSWEGNLLNMYYKAFVKVGIFNDRLFIPSDCAWYSGSYLYGYCEVPNFEDIPPLLFPSPELPPPYNKNSSITSETPSTEQYDINSSITSETSL